MCSGYLAQEEGKFNGFNFNHQENCLCVDLGKDQAAQKLNFDNCMNPISKDFSCKSTDPDWVEPSYDPLESMDDEEAIIDDVNEAPIAPSNSTVESPLMKKGEVHVGTEEDKN